MQESLEDDVEEARRAHVAQSAGRAAHGRELGAICTRRVVHEHGIKRGFIGARHVRAAALLLEHKVEARVIYDVVAFRAEQRAVDHVAGCN